MRVFTLGWPQFAVVAVSLGTIAIVLALSLEREVVDVLSRLDVRRYERKLGFEVGLVKGLPFGPETGTWGIVGITPGGAMDRAGIRAGDVPFNHHGYAFIEFGWAVREMEKGRAACIEVTSAEEAQTGSIRHVCLDGSAARR